MQCEGTICEVQYQAGEMFHQTEELYMDARNVMTFFLSRQNNGKALCTVWRQIH